MSTLPILSELPAHFEVEDSRHGALAVRRELAAALRATGFGLESDGRAGPSDLHGRQPLFELRSAGETWVIRHYTHGGLLRWLTGTRFLDGERPFRELVLGERLREHGIRTPEVVAARARRLAAGGWSLTLVTRRVEGVVDLWRVLEEAARGRVAPSTRSRIYAAAGELVARLHALGFVHADLHPRNLLVNESALRGELPQPWLLDLDRSVWREQLEEVERLSNLRRLFRYVARRRERGGLSVPRTDFVRFLRGYDATGQRWKDDWRQVARLHARSRVYHAAGWSLERSFARRAAGSAD